MTVCEKVPEMLLIIGPAIILGRHRGVSEPIITKRMKTVRNEKGLAQPCPLPPRPPSHPDTGTQGKQVSYPSLGPQPSIPLLGTYIHELFPSTPSSPHPIRIY